MDAGPEIGTGPPLLVHDADLDGVPRQTQCVLDPVEQAHGQGDFVRSVHLGLHHIDGPGGAVGPGTAQIVQGAGHGHQGVDHGLVHRLAVEPHRIAQHVMADIADQQHRATLQHEGLAIAAGITAVRVQASGLDLSALLEALRQIAFHQAEPGAIDPDLVLGVHGSDGILAVLDGGEGGFHQQVADPGGIVPTDGAGPIDHDLAVQPVVAKQHAVGRIDIAAPAHQTLGVEETGLSAIDQADPQQAVDHGVAGGVPVAGPVQRGDLVQQPAGMGDDLRPALDVIGTRGQYGGEGVGAVEGIIEAAPPGIGRVQGVTGIGQGHDQLWSGRTGDLPVDVGRADPEVRSLVTQIADLAQEPRLLAHIDASAPLGGPVGVELGLEAVADRQKLCVALAEVRHQSFQCRPEGRRSDVEARQDLRLHKALQDRIGNEAGSHQGTQRWNGDRQVGAPTPPPFCIFSLSR